MRMDAVCECGRQVTRAITRGDYELRLPRFTGLSGTNVRKRDDLPNFGKLSSGITAKRPSLVRKLQNALLSVNPSPRPPPNGRENFVKYLVGISADISPAPRNRESCPQICG